MSTGPPPACASAGRQLDQLLAGLEHDLKNPIANILGYLALLRDDPDETLSPAQAELLTRIEQNCQTTLRLLQDFVYLARRLLEAERQGP